MPESDTETRIDVIFHEMLENLPYDYEANEVVANAIRDFLTEHSEHIQEFEEIVLTYDPEEHGDNW